MLESKELASLVQAIGIYQKDIQESDVGVGKTKLNLIIIHHEDAEFDNIAKMIMPADFIRETSMARLQTIGEITRLLELTQTNEKLLRLVNELKDLLNKEQTDESEKNFKNYLAEF
jgi:hypothetical protein